MRISFVLPPVNFSGGVQVAALYAEALAARGHRVTLVSTPKREPSRWRRLRQWMAGPVAAPPSPLEVMGLDHRVLDRARPVTDADLPPADVVVATWWETAEWVAALAADKGAKVYFVQGHETHLPRYAERAAATYRLPLRKIVVSRWLAEIMAQQYGDTQVDLVPNSIDPGRFHAPARTRQARPTVGLLSSNATVKGLDVAAEALRRLRLQWPHLHVLAFGVQEPPPAVRAAFDEFVLDPPKHRLRELYARCDLWLSASRSEGFNLTAMEAMACRTPVVSTRTGWPVEAIADRVNGLCVPIEDPQALADAAHWILSLPPEHWAQVSEAAWRTVQGRSWKDSIDRFEQALIDAARRPLP